MQLLELFNEPDRDIDRIVQLVSVDAALTAETLKRCNSVQFAGSAPVDGMFEAVTRLGFYEIYCLVTGLITSRTMQPVLARYREVGEHYWEHTVATAVIAGVLARPLHESEACAFTAGLLHDVGKLVLVSVDGVSYADVLRKTGGHGEALKAAETRTHEFNHAELGGRLMRQWGMPEPICVSVERHHQPLAEHAPHRQFVALVGCANALSHRLLAEDANTKVEDEQIAATVTPLGLDAATLGNLLEVAHEELARFRAVLSPRN